jgi:hypothetical protein
MATPASIHAISALVKVAYGLSITAQARSSIESRVAWSGARLSTPCTQLAVNFELATEAINGEFVKGWKRLDAYALANFCSIHMGRDSDGPGIPIETSEIALNHVTIGLGNLNEWVRIEWPKILSRPLKIRFVEPNCEGLE